MDLGLSTHKSREVSTYSSSSSADHSSIDSWTGYAEKECLGPLAIVPWENGTMQGTAEKTAIVAVQMQPDKFESPILSTRSGTEAQEVPPLAGEDVQPRRSKFRVLAIMVALSVSGSRFRSNFSELSSNKIDPWVLAIHRLHSMRLTCDYIIDGHFSSAFSLQLLTRQSWLLLFLRSQQSCILEPGMYGSAEHTYSRMPVLQTSGPTCPTFGDASRSIW